MTSQLKPGATIGILGAGQLGRMLALAASPLGFRTRIFCPTTGPAFDVSAEGMTAKYDDRAALAEFAKGLDVITYEFENIPVETVRFLEQFCPVRPSTYALEVSQDRLSEKTFLEENGVPVARFHAIDEAKSLEQALSDFGGRGVLKTRRFGYDGKGQIMLRPENPIDAQTALDELGNVPLILEELVSFKKEISVIVIRSANGESAAYDVAENVHENHILKTSTVPANLLETTADKACALATRIVKALDYVGAMGVEFFVLEVDGDEHLLVNEIAPRVHNSGHWTMDACATSQFEQHIRAICAWPLGLTHRHSDVVMHNLLGDEIKGWAAYAADKQAHFHDYAKRDARSGRKMGHVNILKTR